MGKNSRAKQNGTGPYKGIAMAKSGRTGKKSSMKKGSC